MIKIISRIICSVTLVTLLLLPTTVVYAGEETQPEQAVQMVKVQSDIVTEPTLYCLGSCPTLPSARTQVDTTTIPTTTVPAPSESTPTGTAETTPSVSPAPCETGTVNVQHKRKRHKLRGDSLMQQFFQFLQQLINLILQLLGGNGNITLPSPAPTPCDPGDTTEPTSVPEPTESAQPTSGTPNATVAPTQANVTTAPVPTGSTGTINPPIAGVWKLVFNDDFNGTSLDATKWNTGWFGTGITTGVNSAEQNCYDPAQVTVSGGSAIITAIQKSISCGGKTQPYATGMASTMNKYSYTYGYAESKMWMPGGAQISNWPGFWINGNNHDTGGEIDVMEGLSGKACYHYHHSGSSGACANGTWTNGWHTFGALWEQGKVTFYYDGKQVGTATNGVAGEPMYLLLQNAVGGWGGPISVPAAVKFDYVKVWQKQ